MKLIDKLRGKFSGGISVRYLSAILSVAAALAFILTYRVTVDIGYKYDELIKSVETYDVCEKAAQEIMMISDSLTENSRLYVSTGEKSYLDQYFKEVKVDKEREKALLQIKTALGYSSAVGVEKAIKDSMELMNNEYYAMKLIATVNGEDLSKLPEEISSIKISYEDSVLSPEKMRRKADDVVYGREYVQYKTRIRSQINEYLNSIISMAYEKNKEETSAFKDNLRWQSLMLIILFIVDVIMFLSLIFLFLKPLNNFNKSVQAGEAVRAEGAAELRNLAETYNRMHSSSDTNMKLNKELKKSNITDPLTGIYNRKGFEEITNSILRGDSAIGFMLMDIDKFKEINDTFGHPAGDRALCVVAWMLVKFFRSGDYVFRIGGDEFAVIINNVTAENKETINDKFDAINKELRCYQMFENTLSVSGGIAFSENGYNSTVYNKADSALYVSKKNGRKQCSFYEEEMKS